MKIKRIAKPFTNSGGFAVYVRLDSRKGIKVLNTGYSTIKEAKLSPCWAEAKEEARLLKLAYKSGIVPKCYGVEIVKYEDEYHVAIVMQHLGTKTLTKLTYEKPEMDWEEILEEMHDKLAMFGIYHNDVHRDNIMFHNKQYWLIDFSPNYIEVDREVA